MIKYHQKVIFNNIYKTFMKILKTKIVK